MGLLVVIVLVLLLFCTLPVYAYSRPWGYRPSGIVGLMLVVILVLLLVGSIPWGFPRPVYLVKPVIVPRPVRVVPVPVAPRRGP